MDPSAPSSLLLIPFIATPLLLMTGVILLIVGLRGRLAPIRAQCIGCAHELHDPLPDRCAECGLDLTPRGERGERSIRWGVLRRRPVVSLVGISVLALGVLSAMAIPLWAYASISPNVALRDAEQLLAMSPESLGAHIRALDASGEAWTALETALMSPRFDASRALAAAEATVDWIHAHVETSGSSISTMGGWLLGRLLGSGLLTDDQIDAILMRAVGQPELLVARVVRVGEPLEVSLRPMRPYLVSALSGGVIVNAGVESVLLDGHPLPAFGDDDDHAPGGIGGVLSAPRTDPRFGPQVRVQLIEEGVAELEVVVRIEAQFKGGAAGQVVTPLAPVGQGGTIAQAQSVIWPLPVSPLSAAVTVVGPETPLPLPVVDESRADELRAGIRVARLRILRDLDGARRILDLELECTPVDVAAMDFDVQIELDSSPPLTLDLGDFRCMRRGVRGPFVGSLNDTVTFRHADWVPPLDDSVRTATILLTPRNRMGAEEEARRERSRESGGVSSRVTRILDHVWALPVRLDGLTVAREDLDATRRRATP